MEDLTKSLEDSAREKPNIPDISLDRTHDETFSKPQIRKTPYVHKSSCVRIEYREEESQPAEV